MERKNKSDNGNKHLLYETEFNSNKIKWELNKEEYDEYFEWLCNLVGVNRFQHSYWHLAEYLHQKSFISYVPNDDNRASEGKNLRENFCKESYIDYVYELWPDEISVLELIISLAYRCENIMIDQDDNVPMSDWFWELINNVGLDDFPDDAYIDPLYIEEIVNKIINRTYTRTGKGGLFPIKSCKKDQRKVELWYQMNTYLIERYFKE